jgi:hypothetical protein
MATFKAQVEAWVGTVTDTSALDSMLCSAAKWVINLLPESILTHHAADLTDTAGASATFTVTLNAGGVTAVPIVGAGTGYPPYVSLTIAHATGTGAKAYAVANASGVIVNTYVTAAGTGYTGTAATATVAGSSGVTTSGHRILGAHKLGYPASFIDAIEKGRYADANSIFLATAKRPVAYLENDKGYVIPSGGTLRGVPYPTVGNADSTVANFPDQLEPALSLYAAIQYRIKQIETVQAITGALAWVAPTVVTVPGDASFTSTDAVVSTIAATTIVALGSAPTYTKPTITGFPATLNTLDVSAITAPAVPSAPAITATDAVAGTIAATTLVALSSPPTYTAPASPASFSYSNAGTAITTNEDIELGQAELQYVQTQLKEYETRLNDSAANYKVASEVYQAQIAYKIGQAKLDQERLVAAAQLTQDANIKNEAQTLAALIQDYTMVLQKFQGDLKRFTDLVDTEIKEYQGNVARLQVDRVTLIQQYQADIENEYKEFEKENVAYQAELQMKISQAKLDQERLSAVAAMTTDLNLRNEAQENAAEVALAATILDKFRSEVQRYAAEVQREVQRITTSLQRSAENVKELELSIKELRGELMNFIAPFLPQKQTKEE